MSIDAIVGFYAFNAQFLHLPELISTLCHFLQHPADDGEDVLKMLLALPKKAKLAHSMVANSWKGW